MPFYKILHIAVTTRNSEKLSDCDQFKEWIKNNTKQIENIINGFIKKNKLYIQ